MFRKSVLANFFFEVFGPIRGGVFDGFGQGGWATERMGDGRTDEDGRTDGRTDEDGRTVGRTRTDGRTELIGINVIPPPPAPPPDYFQK